MKYTGSCHCGEVQFEVDSDGELAEVLDCNCSICARRGSLLWFVDRDQLRLLTPEDGLSTYTFNREAIKHRFCGRCGIHSFGEGTDPASGKAMAAVNVRCIDGVDLAALKVNHFDGRSL